MSFAYQDITVELPQGQLALRRYGSEKDAVVLVLGGISGGRNIYQADPQNAGRGWWQGLVEHAELQGYCLLAVDYFGGMGASHCKVVPTSVEAHAEILLAALQQLGVDRLHGIIGGSFGGCVALAMTQQGASPDARIAVLGAAHRPTAQAVILRSLQREFVALGQAAGASRRGVELARALAMLSYRGARGLDTRFADPSGAVAYVHARAAQLVDSNPFQAEQLFARFGPALDNYRVPPQAIRNPLLLVSFADDYLAPKHLMTEFANLLPNCRDHIEVATVHGHDGFILNTASYGPQLKQFLEDA